LNFRFPKTHALKKILPLLAVALLALSFTTDTKISADNLKINQVQIIATHNSYHLKTDKAVFRFLKFLYSGGVLPGGLNPEEIDYTKDSLSVQLGRYNVRGLELDVWNDPEGGRFYHRKGKAYVWKRTASGIDALKQPGFKILHIPDFDFNVTNYTFKDAIAEIKRWSDANPNHLPVFINVESETSAPGDMVHMLHNLTRAAPIDSIALDNLDNEVKSVFGPNLDGVITPDNVRGNYATLEQAVLAGNWPTIAAARGKVIFIIDWHENVAQLYKTGHPSFKGRAMFTYADPGTPEAAFVIMNGPYKKQDQIKETVKKGYIVPPAAMMAPTRPAKATTAAWKRPFQAAPKSSPPITTNPITAPAPKAGAITMFSSPRAAWPGLIPSLSALFYNRYLLKNNLHRPFFSIFKS
jgi:calcium-dependent phosphoinositide phospholipase C